MSFYNNSNNVNIINNLSNIDWSPSNLNNYEISSILSKIINEVNKNNKNIENIEKNKNYENRYNTIKKEKYQEFDNNEVQLKIEILMKKNAILEKNLEKEKIQRSNELKDFKRQIESISNLDSLIDNKLDKIKWEIESNHKHNLEKFIKFVENNINDTSEINTILNNKLNNDEYLSFKNEFKIKFNSLEEDNGYKIDYIGSKLKEIDINLKTLNNKFEEKCDNIEILKDNDNELIKKFNKLEKNNKKFNNEIETLKDQYDGIFNDNKKNIITFENLTKNIDNIDKYNKNNIKNLNSKYNEIINNFDDKLSINNEIYLNKLKNLENFVSNNKFNYNEIYNKINNEYFEKLLTNKLDKATLDFEINKIFKNFEFFEKNFNDKILIIKNDLSKVNNNISNKMDSFKYDDIINTFITIKELNELANEIRNEVRTKANFYDMEEFMLEQNKVNNFLCSENFLCRYKWRNNSLLNKNIIPWEIQSINTLSDNFIRDNGKIYINTSGLYEIKVGFNSILEFMYSIYLNNSSIYQNSNKEKNNIKQFLHSSNYLFIKNNSILEIKYSGKLEIEGFIQIKRL